MIKMVNRLSRGLNKLLSGKNRFPKRLNRLSRRLNRFKTRISLNPVHTFFSVSLLASLPGACLFIMQHHPAGNPGVNIKSVSHRCLLREVSFEWESTKETIYLPPGLSAERGANRKASCCACVQCEGHAESESL